MEELPSLSSEQAASAPSQHLHRRRRRSRRVANNSTECLLLDKPIINMDHLAEKPLTEQYLSGKPNNEGAAEMPITKEELAEKPVTMNNNETGCLSEKPSSSKGPFKPVNCNLDRFLESTCPSVRVHHLPKSCQWETCRKRQQDGNMENLPYIILGDLWDSLDEWSAYGAGVPITLKGQEVVVQYYVPYLSALQLYTRSMKRPNIRCRGPSGMESDCCSVSSSDGDDMAVPDPRNCLCGIFHYPVEDAATCCACDTFKSISKVNSCCNFEEDENRSSSSFQDRDWHRHLRFEYFESSPPYSRVPLSEKIAQLAVNFPELKTLRSVDLLPASWMSIAWYPIYRIPTGPTLQDLEACFLTFHSLSTSLQDGEPSGIVKPSSRPTACAVSLSSAESQWEYPAIHLEAFGLAHYKLRGSIWTSVGNPERRHAASLYRCAESWLEQLRVGHPDFNFFRSHNPASSNTHTHPTNTHMHTHACGAYTG